MRNQVILDIQEAYHQIYNQQVDVNLNEDYDIFNDIVEFCEEIEIFDSINESEYFANLVIENNLTQIFIEDVLEYFSQAQLLDEEYITEISGSLLKQGLKIASGILRKLPKNATGLPAKTLLKKGIRPTGISSKGKQLSGAARTDDIARTQAARAARRPPEPQKPNRYLDLLNAKRSSATTPSQTGPSFIERGWQRHNAAKGTETALATLLGPALFMGLKGAAKPTSKAITNVAASAPISRTLLPRVASSAPVKKVTGAAADPWKQFMKKSPRQYGLPKPPSPKPESSKVLTGSPQPKGLLPPAKTTSKPTVDYNALPRQPKVSEPGGALVPTRGANVPAHSTSPGEVQRSILPASSRSTSKSSKKPSGTQSGSSSRRTPSDAGLPFRATGPGGDARIQRLASQSAPGSSLNLSAIKGKTSNASGAIPATLAGVAAAGTAAALIDRAEKERKERLKPRYNTMDPSGRIRSRLAVGPKIVGPEIVGPDTFERAFKRARRSGKKEFTYGNQKFTTQMAEEFFINYLLDEGFAHCEKTAYGIMDVMSEEWFQSIIEA